MKRKKASMLLLMAVLTLGLCACGMSAEKKYNQAVADVKAGKYDEAIEAFEALNDYEDSGKYIMYARCLKTGDGGDYETAVKSLISLGDFKEAGIYVKYYTALGYEAEQKYEEAGEVYDGILLFKDVQTRNAALPDKILDRDLAEAERDWEEDGWYALSEMVGKKYTTSETQMYENIMDFAAQLHEKQEYGKAASAYLLVKEDGYEKADAGFKESAYQYVQELMTDKVYTDARSIINEYLSGYKDADELVKECSYQLALETEARGAQGAQAAYDAFRVLETYKDSANHTAAYETKYAEAVSAREAIEFDVAITLFTELGTYLDSSDRLTEAENAKAYAEGISKREANEFDAAIALFTELGTYLDSSDRLTEARNAKAYAEAISLMTDEKYEEAIEAFRALNGYSDSAVQIEACEAAILERGYQKAISLVTDKKYEEAIEAFRALNGYSDSAVQIEACEAAILEREYQKAEALREGGQYAEAYTIYATICGYRDVDEIIKAVAVKIYQPGNYVTFGTYLQTASGMDNTSIEWLVLESDGETALLISRYALDCQPYNTERVDITWEQCTLRRWLNEEFYNHAFSEDEKQSIFESDVSADRNPSYSTNPGNATRDNVFLLSTVEANKYFASDEARMCVSTDYAIQQGAYAGSDYTVDGRGTCWWWLRSPGYDCDFAALVSVDGSLDDFGPYVNDSDLAVRPCVRVRLF